MSQDKLKSIIESEIDNSIGFLETETTQQRTDALQSYLRQPYGNEVEGKSSIVTGEVAEAVDGSLPPLVRIFSASDEVVRFDPRGPQDEAGAKQATEYVNWVFMRDNDGLIIMHDWFKDALLQKVGVVKAYWEDKEDITKEKYRDLSDDELAMLLSDETMEVVEKEVVENEMTDPAGNPVLDQMGNPVMYSSNSVTVQKKKKSGHVVVENVPPEEFLISKRAKRSPQDAPFVAHRRLITRSDLIAMGFDADVVNGLQTSSALTFSPEYLARVSPGETVDDGVSLDESMDTIEVFECYVRADIDGDGIAELRQVFYASNEILSDEETDYIPFHSLCPIPTPHKFFGESMADRTMDIQLIKTTITRQILDNLYLTNAARVTAVDGQVNLDDLLTSTAGGVIRVKSQGAVQQLNVQNVAGQAFPMLQYMDSIQQKRTGVTEASQGLDPSILQNVTAAAVASMQQSSAGKIEMIARIFAETGVKSLFKGILHLLCKYQDKARIVRMRGSYVSFDPREWSNQYDVDINVGLGAGNRQEQMAMLNMVLGKQEQILGQMGPANPLVTMGQYRNTLGRMVEAAGFKDSAEFYKSITPEQDQQISTPQQTQQPPIPPEVQAYMAKTQADIQAKQAKAQADIQLAREKAAAELQLLRDKNIAQIQLEREKAEAMRQLKEEEFMAEARLKAMKVGAGITSNVEIPG
jgi:hypothetical protein